MAVTSHGLHGPLKCVLFGFGPAGFAGNSFPLIEIAPAAKDRAVLHLISGHVFAQHFGKQLELQFLVSGYIVVFQQWDTATMGMVQLAAGSALPPAKHIPHA